jgi:two-component system response regulator LytT
MRVKLQVSPESIETYIKELKYSGHEVCNDHADIIIRESCPELQVEANVPVLLMPEPALEGLTKILRLLPESPKKDIAPASFLLCREESLEMISCQEVFFFDAQGDYVYSQSPLGRLEIKLKLYEIAEKYASFGFIRISKSTVVNILQIREIVPWFGSRILLRFKNCHETREVSRRYTRSFKEFIGINR